MLMPKKVKYRKQQRGRRAGNAKGGDYIAFGDFALQALEPGWVTARQIEAARIAISRARQARRQGVDPGLPGQADHQEAARDPHGQGQGQPRGVGGGGQAGAHPLRARGRARRRSPRRRCGWRPTSCRIKTRFISRHEELR